MATLSKQEFVNFMYRLQDLSDKMDRVDKAFHRLDPDFCSFHIGEAIKIGYDLLCKAMNDKYEWLDYFIFDLDFLRGYYPGCVTDKYDKAIDVNDWYKVYDFLVEEGE
ncbi:MAG TPA: hypothetical protein DCW90_04140 [Lachnospiraceae bacterium]|nr:hypothetical protein [Lachnospiraceae bacterium]